MPPDDAVDDPVEHRFIEWSDIELCDEKREDGAATRIAKGYAAVFEKLSVDLGGFREKIAKGAFAESIQRDVVALWSHNTDLVLGRTSNKTLELEEDDKGLRFKLAFDDDQWGDYAFRKIQRKDVKGMSFGFRIPPNGADWEINEQKQYTRVLKKIYLHEISPTAFPAYPQTTVSTRSVEDVLRSAPTLPPQAPVPRNVSLELRRLRLVEATC